MLEFIAFFFTVQSHSYHKSKFINSANNITGGIYKKANSIGEFFNLKEENKRLLEENTQLKNLISLESFGQDSISKISIDTSNFFRRYQFSSAKIYNNNYSSRNNYLLINKGLKDGVYPEMGVVNSKGIVGVTKSVSKNYATVISVLNKYSQINVKLKNNDHFGTLSWDGKDYRTLQLLDLPRQAIIKVGDTVITGGKSTIFPEGIMVGTIKDFEKTNTTFKTININLFNDMSSLSNVNIITNLHKEEIQQLEESNNE
ncbi:rod shape-determining protein MreC [Urechidicola croceus]|uniref:rod shape-determining protein MreC n=1 Tax=Urechidicola croceus TaxID=1850246 RepID=UPI0029371E55|nr:rod shape-determining protein MreC [Urechidicola croceus]